MGLPADPSLLHATVLSACLAVLWQNDGKPRVEKKFYSGMAVVLQATAIFIGALALALALALHDVANATAVVIDAAVNASADTVGDVLPQAPSPL